MNKEDITIPTIFLGLIILTSLVPVVQIILMTLNGGLTSFLTIPFDKNESTMETVGIVSNSLLTIIGLLLFHNSKETWTRILTSILVLFAGQGAMLFTIGKILNEDNSYYIYWIVLSGTPVLLTLLVGLFKYRNLTTQHQTKS